MDIMPAFEIKIILIPTRFANLMTVWGKSAVNTYIYLTYVVSHIEVANTNLIPIYQ